MRHAWKVRRITFSWLLEPAASSSSAKSSSASDDVDVGHLAELAQLDRGELHVERAAAAEHVHVGDGRRLEPGEHVVGHLGRAQVDGVLREHAGDVEGDVAVADDGDLGCLERPLARHVGVPVEPGHEVGGAVGAGQVDAGDVERGVPDRAGGEDHGVVALLQVVDRDVAADLDVADEADGAGVEHLVQRVHDALDARVVGRDAVADQAVGRGQRVEQVDRDGAARGGHGVREDVAGVDAGGTGADDRDAQVEGVRHGGAFRSVDAEVAVVAATRRARWRRRACRARARRERRGSGGTTSPTTTTAGERMPRSAACAAIVASVPTVTRWPRAEAVLDDRDGAVGSALAARRA